MIAQNMIELLTAEVEKVGRDRPLFTHTVFTISSPC